MPDIGHMQKGSALKSDVDKGRLHSRQHPGHLAKINIANQAALERSLDMQFLQGTVSNNGNPRFLRRPVDQDIFMHRTSSVGHGAESPPGKD